LKIEIEKILCAVWVGLMIAMVIIYETPNSDNYVHYLSTKVFVKHPDILLPKDLTVEPYGTSLALGVIKYYNYPPFQLFLYSLTELLGLAHKFWFIIPILLIGVFLYKLDKRALPILMLSFMFTRTFIFGNNDNWITAFTLISIYFLMNDKPILSSLFIGLCPLVKGTGWMSVGAWGICLLLFYRKELFKFNTGNKYLLGVILALLIILPWHIRNGIACYRFEEKCNIIAIFVGSTQEKILETEEWVSTGFQENQPERKWIDFSGYYPLPIDLLMWIGAGFTIFNIIKTKELDIKQIFILIFMIVFIIIHTIDFRYLSEWRYYEVVFPLLAIEVVKPLSKKLLLIMYVICILLFAFWLIKIGNYSHNPFQQWLKGEVCPQIKGKIGDEPVYVEAHSGWELIYVCDLNSTTADNSKWYFNLEKQILIPTLQPE